ncbi:lysophospholipid acyltransferase family protein [Luteococcus peritonei]|uniref:Lysophospholipid acyltransferase family protein n=1 Tax=Luteococcus peritonei TaxID=88874 RepID=A0ABW4RTS2_9ACTN
MRTGAQYLLLKPAVWRLVDVQVHGTEHLDGLEGAYIAVANHSSHLDAPLIMGSLPRRLSQYLATGAAADYFFDRWWKAAPTALFFNAFPVDRKGTRGRKGMAGNLLSDGVPLLLFPEGTRSRTGEMAPFKPGAAALCISRNVPAVPVALVGAYAAWPYKQNTPPRNRPTVHVVFGHPMMPQPGEIAHQFNERMRRQVLELHDSTARAYGMKTLAEYAHTAALDKARTTQDNTQEKQ